jgi:PiT family inorganic phosphate transporter
MEILLGLDAAHGILLCACVLLALGFEFVNGFHDTANAVATVIYTNTMPPRIAVAVSGVCNFLGVFLGGIAVAMGLMKLLPVELLVERGAGAGLAMVLALLLSAILWNVGTWYLGLPASSSHTLIGAILGVGLANSALSGHGFGHGVNWSKAQEIGLSLLLSPLLGFGLAALLFLLIRRLAKNPGLFRAPQPGVPPPAGTRALLIATCSGVSFAHGSNDGQKGVGLMMLILMGIVPATFALNLQGTHAQIEETRAAAASLIATVREHSDRASQAQAQAAIAKLEEVQASWTGVGEVKEVPPEKRFDARRKLLLADAALDTLIKAGGLGLSEEQAAALKLERKRLRALTDYAPHWVLMAIALALGLGTMVGWKRIVVTVGERIGKAHLSYAQGASAEIVAMSTIGLAGWAGLPVSTTHVLSSGVAGTMVSQGAGVQSSTVVKIALAWVFTLPASILLSAILFDVLRFLLH